MTLQGYLTVGDVAAELGVSPATVRHWCAKRWIRYEWHTIGKRKQRVFTAAAVTAFKRRAARPGSGIRSQREFTNHLVEALQEALASPAPTKKDARRFHRAMEQLERDRKKSDG